MAGQLGGVELKPLAFVGGSCVLPLFFVYFLFLLFLFLLLGENFTAILSAATLGTRVSSIASVTSFRMPPIARFS